jgi:hypothetical protein
MRTTVDLDDDVLLVVKERARRERRSAGAVLSELARRGLSASSVEGAPRGGRPGFRPLPSRGAPVTNAMIDALREDE